MHDMEAMVDLLRFGVPQWRHERLQARSKVHNLALVSKPCSHCARRWPKLWLTVLRALCCLCVLRQLKAGMVRAFSAAASSSVCSVSVQRHSV